MYNERTDRDIDRPGGKLERPRMNIELEDRARIDDMSVVDRVRRAEVLERLRIRFHLTGGITSSRWICMFVA
jgi:hypothetical protein